MYSGSAFIVWSRLPPASCISTAAPEVPDGVAHLTIFETPGFFQSSLSVSTKTLV